MFNIPRHVTFTLRLPLILFVVVSIFLARLESQARITRRCVAGLSRGIAREDAGLTHSWAAYDFEFEPDGRSSWWYTLFSNRGEEYAGSVVAVFLRGRDVNDEMLDYVLPLTRIKRVSVENTSLTDDGIKKLAALRHLESIHIEGHSLSPATVADFQSLPKLTGLSLYHCSLNAAALRLIGELPALRKLNLDRVDLDDRDVAHIARNRRLTHLDLNNTNITSDAIRHIRYLSELESLNLRNTGVGDDVVDLICAFKSLKQITMGGSCISEAGTTRISQHAFVCDIYVPNPADFW